MTSGLILLAIICIPLNFLWWVWKLKQIKIYWGQALNEKTNLFGAFGTDNAKLAWAWACDFVIDLGGTLFISALGGGGVTSLIIGGVGGLVLSIVLGLWLGFKKEVK